MNADSVTGSSARPAPAGAATKTTGSVRGSLPPSGRSKRTTEELAPFDRSVGLWADSGFWLLQLVVLALYLLRLAVTVAFGLASTGLALELSTFVLFLVPVLVAAFRHGRLGAVVTAGWITVLAIPRVAYAAGHHDPVAVWLEVVQVLLLDLLAVLVGGQVTAERSAREIADSARAAHLRAEALYRDLFDSNQAPILIVDGEGRVVDANAAADLAFGSRATALSDEPNAPTRLVDMIGPDAAAEMLTRLVAEPPAPARTTDVQGTLEPERIQPIRFQVGGQPVLYRPTATMLDRSRGGGRMQVVFEDVTAETRRHDLMEAYAAQVVLGQEEERRHIAQELHDGPLQSLVHLCRQIDAFGSTGSRPGAGPDLASLRSTVEETVTELRSIAKGLRPSVLDDLGLVASINQLLEDAARRQGFQVSFGVTGTERRIPGAVELALFRIVQEALSNAERHAAARKVAVGLDFETLGLRVLVKDDGVGFDVVAHHAEGRARTLGIAGMNERARLTGARLAVHSAPGKGTTVDVWVPAVAIERV